MVEPFEHIEKDDTTMGKNRHSKDRLFVTQTEHKYLYGGKKAEIKRAYRRTFDPCNSHSTHFCIGDDVGLQR